MDEIEKIYNLSKLDKSKKNDLEKALNSDKLNEQQKRDLIGVCYLYSNMIIEPLHKKKYNSYRISDLIKEVKEGKTPIEIMNDIITECDKYSTTQIIQKHKMNRDFLKDARS